MSNFSPNFFRKEMPGFLTGFFFRKRHKKISNLLPNPRTNFERGGMGSEIFGFLISSV
ncbi:MAG: hypothetical protein ABIK81_01005 [candidate division WOR-3 bacterium]